MTAGGRLAGSFRDPDGFVFMRDGVLYRQVNQSCRQDYQLLMDSGLYAKLVEDGLLVPWQDADVEPAEPATAWRIIRPEPLEFISYPYEWCFSQLKQAALTTLTVQKLALRHGMTLKDASSFNVQFCQGRCVLMDSLSLTRYVPGTPWVAYRQFCQHFLAGLALAARRDCRLAALYRGCLDGIPLDLASGLLPRRSWLSPGLLTHLHLHARFQKTRGGPESTASKGRLSLRGFLGLLDSLEGCVESARWKPRASAWSDYGLRTSYSQVGAESKTRIVSQWLDACRPGSLWDLGANDGHFSRLAAARGIATVAMDSDMACVERNYLSARQAGLKNILPLLMDLANPSPAVGWAHQERMSLAQRGPADCLLALALIHHLAIGNNVPLERIAEFLARLGRSLIVEFVPKHDPQVRRMLSGRADIFEHYCREGFEAAFSRHFHIAEAQDIADSPRRLYLMGPLTGGRRQ